MPEEMAGCVTIAALSLVIKMAVQGGKPPHIRLDEQVNNLWVVREPPAFLDAQLVKHLWMPVVGV